MKHTPTYFILDIQSASSAASHCFAKRADGKVYEYATAKEAQASCDRLNSRDNAPKRYVPYVAYR